MTRTHTICLCFFALTLLSCKQNKVVSENVLLAKKEFPIAATMAGFQQYENSQTVTYKDISITIKAGFATYETEGYITNVSLYKSGNTAIKVSNIEFTQPINTNTPEEPMMEFYLYYGITEEGILKTQYRSRSFRLRGDGTIDSHE